MRPRPDRHFRGWWIQGSDQTRRPSSRPRFDLEVLESRLLMAAWSAGSSATYHGAIATIPTPIEMVPTPSPTPAQPDSDGGVAETGTHHHHLGSYSRVVIPPTDDNYTIVRETPAFHGSLPTAQSIPDVPYAGVIGKVSLGDKIDLYRVVLGPGTLALRLASTFGSSRVTGVLQLFAFDALGNVIASTSSSAGILDLKLDARQLGLAPGSTVEIGVATSASGRDSASLGYQLWFLRESETPATPGETGDLSSPVETVVPGPAVVIPGGLTTVTGAAGSALASAGPASGSTGVSVFGAPQLPTISAAGSGGVLADGEPTTSLAPSASADELAGWSATTVVVQGKESNPADTDADLEDPGRPLIARQGPGGFPVLVAAAIGDWRPTQEASGDSLARALLDESLVPCAQSAHNPEIEVANIPVPQGSPTLVAVGDPPSEPVGAHERRPYQRVLGAAVAVTLYAVSVDRMSLQDLFEASTGVKLPRMRVGGRWRAVRRRLSRRFR